MIVLHPFAPSTPAVRQHQTWQLLELLRRHGRHVVIDWPLLDELDYSAALAWCWNRGQVLCVLEHDVVPTLEDLVRLEACDQAVICTQAVPAPGAPAQFLFRVRDRDGLRWGREGELWADMFPLACTVFRPAAMHRLPAFPRHVWQGLDHELSLRLSARVHVHWPAAYHAHQ